MIDVLWLALRLAIGGVLVVSAFGKVRSMARFADDLGRYGLLPPAAVVPAAWLVAGAEAIAAALVLAGSVAGFWLAVGLFAVFAVAVGSALGRHLAIPCGCFGGDDPVSGVALVRLALLLGGCLGGLALALGEPARLVSGWALPMAVTVALGGLMLGRLALLVPEVRAALGRTSGTGAATTSGTYGEAA